MDTAKKQTAGTRALLFIVISMGLALVGGAALLAAKLAGGGAGKAPAVGAPSSATKSGCEPQVYTLADDESSKVLGTEGRFVTLEVFSSERGTSIRQINLCSGAVAAQLTIIQ